MGFAFRDCLRVLQDAGTEVDRAFAVGGGSNSPVWLSIMANILDRPLDVSAEADVGAAYGAARLGLAAVSGGSDPAALMPPPPVARTIEPDKRFGVRLCRAIRPLPYALRRRSPRGRRLRRPA